MVWKICLISKRYLDDIYPILQDENTHSTLKSQRKAAQSLTIETSAHGTFVEGAAQWQSACPESITKDDSSKLLRLWTRLLCHYMLLSCDIKLQQRISESQFGKMTPFPVHTSDRYSSRLSTGLQYPVTFFIL